MSPQKSCHRLHKAAESKSVAMSAVPAGQSGMVAASLADMVEVEEEVPSAATAASVDATRQNQQQHQQSQPSKRKPAAFCRPIAIEVCEVARRWNVHPLHADHDAAYKRV